MDPARHEDAVRLLEATHDFPCPFLVKVIGRSENDFVSRVVGALRDVQQLDSDPPYRIRKTPKGAHVAVTFEPMVTSPEEALEIYACLRRVEGLVMIL